MTHRMTHISSYCCFFKVIDGKPEYSGMMDVLVKTVRNEGVFALWKGWTPYFARTGPQTVVTLMLMDAFMHQYRTMAS